MTTNTNPPRWRRMTVAAVGAGAIAVGAMVLSAPAAQAEAWETMCPLNPVVFHPDALSGVFRVSRDGNDRFEFCDVYSVAGVSPDHRPGGDGFLTTYSQYFQNFYRSKPPRPAQVSQVPTSPQG
jgi:hypothetical protein